VRDGTLPKESLTARCQLILPPGSPAPDSGKFCGGGGGGGGGGGSGLDSIGWAWGLYICGAPVCMLHCYFLGCCRVLQSVQSVAVCCSVLQSVGAVCRLRVYLCCVVVCISWCVLQRVAVCYSASQCVAVCCSVLQCDAVCCIDFQVR